MREIILDTETTGLDPNAGHRVVEIGCVELVNLIPTGRVYHQYINPERDMPAEAFQVHGLSAEFLSKHPKFDEIVLDFLTFLGDDSKLVIHNASFDMKFLDFELARLGHVVIDRTRVIDTLAIARKQNPGGRNSLDALCKRYEINNKHRELHGALLDSELLAEVYLHLRGGRQPGFALLEKNATAEAGDSAKSDVENLSVKADFVRRQFDVPAHEAELHAEFIKEIKNSKWQMYS